MCPYTQQLHKLFLKIYSELKLIKICIINV